MRAHDAETAAFRRRQRGYVLSSEHDRAVIRRKRAGEDREQRRLTGAIRPDDAHGLAWAHGKRDAIENHKAR